MATWKKLLHESSAASDFPTLNQNTTGSAATLTTARAIAVSGDVTGSANFNGSAGISISSTIANNAVTSAKIADEAVGTDQIEPGAITSGLLNQGVINDSQLIADDIINSQHYVNGSIDAVHLASNSVTTAKITDANVTAAKIASDAVITAKIENDAVTNSKIADEAVDANKMANNAVGAGVLAASAITGQTAETSIADDDVLLIYDTSASALRKMTKANLVSGLSSEGQLTNEEVQDIVGGMLSGNTETGITVTYDDTNNEIDFVVASQTDNNFTTTLKNKLDGIEGSADVTDATNVTAAGALMDSECSSLADVKALDQSVISGASPTFSTANMTDATDKRFMSNAQEVKLDSVETNADVTDSTNVKSALNANLGTLTLGDSDDTVSIPGNLTVSGATTTLNTATLTVEDKNIKLADVSSPTTTTANGAGIQVETSATEAEWPEFKWDNSGKLTGWTLSDHKSSGNEDFPISVMKFGTSAPSGQPDSGQGTFFADGTNNEIYIYV